MSKTFVDVPLPGLEGFAREARGVEPRRRVDPTLRPTEAARISFWRRVVKAPGDGCWIFTGAISSPDGYGRIAWRSGGRERTLSAHRFALEIAHGRLDESVVVEHRCNEPLCVRVGIGHVIPSTQTENMRYAAACGRARGPGDGSVVVNRVARSLAVRAAVRDGWNPDGYAAALTAGRTALPQQSSLFDT